jgi:hypothetical protein
VRRAAFLLLASSAFALALALAPEPPAVGGSALASVGRGLGGLRVLLVDGILLVADARVRAGRVWEVPALYEAALELDPDNEAAIEHLARVHAFDLLGQAPGVEAKLLWWREAWHLAAAGLERRPRSARLHLLASDLLSTALLRHEDLKTRLDAERGDVLLEALERALAAARLAPEVGMRGRSHLVRIAELGSAVAARRLPDGRGLERVLAILDETLVLRGDALGHVRLALPEGASPESLPMDRVLALRLEALRAVRAALLSGDRPAAAAAVAAYAAVAPGDAFGDLLARAARGE